LIMNKIKKQFTVNAASGFLAQLSFVAVGFVMMPYAIRQLGKQGYGIYQLAQSALVFFTFLQAGMGPTLLRFCSQAITLKDTNQIRKISSTAQLIMGTLGVFGMAVIVALIPLFIRFYDIPTQLYWETAGLLICLAFSLLLNMMFIVPQGIVFASNRYDLANGIEILSNILRLLLIIVAFEFIRPSIFLIGIAILLANILRFAALFSIGAFNIGKSMFFSFRLVDRVVFHEMFRFSMLTFLNTVAFGVAAQAPVLIIAKVHGTTSVTVFAPAILVANALSGFICQIARPLTPLASKDQNLNKGANLGKWSTYVSQLTCCFGLGCILPLSVFGQELMELWVGSDLASTWFIVVLMAFGGILSQSQSANLNLSLGSGSIKPFVYSQLFLSGVLITGLLIGTVLWNWYLLGISIFIVTCRCIRNVGYLSYIGSKSFSYNYFKYIKDVYAEPIIGFIISVALGYVAKHFFYTKNILFIGVEIVFIMAVYTLTLWMFILKAETKATIRSLVFRTSMPNQP